MRNEWSNYTNWPYDGVLPFNVYIPNSSTNKPYIGDCSGISYYPSEDLDKNPTGIFWTGVYQPMNQKDIMSSWGLLVDGKYRENVQPSGVVNYVEKYVRTSGNAPDGLFSYNFCLNTSPFDFQPSGAMNMSKFTNITFEVETMYPILDEEAQVKTICNLLNQKERSQI